MFSTFSASTADSLWRTVRDAFVLRSSSMELQEGRGGDTDEILHATLTIEDPRQRWITAREPALNVAFALAEVVWMLCGRNDSGFLNYFNSQLPAFAGTGSTYHGAYGYRLVHHFGINQLERAYQALDSNRSTRQVVLQIWDSRLDLPQPDGAPAAPDIPCNLFSMLKIRSGKLEWLQVMRSNDVFLGLPHNLVQFTMLQEVFAGWLGIEVGSYHQISDSLHVYEKDRESLFRLNDEPEAPNTDSVASGKAMSDDHWRQLEIYTEGIIDDTVDAGLIMERARTADLPLAFSNILRVLSAEGLRRRGATSMADETMSDCTNPAFRRLWDRWAARLVRKDR